MLITSEGDRVLVGLNSGALRVYRLNDFNDDEPLSPSSLAATSPPSNGNGNDAANQNAAAVPRSGRATDLLREVERFSTKPIEQLAMIKEANTLVSLSNYQISLYDLQTYDLIETLGKSKNASCFAVTSNIVKDADTNIPEIISRLAVAVKRRLYLWSWHESELSDEVQELVLSESIRSVTWASATKLVCGMNGGYVAVDVVSQAMEEIVSPGLVGAGNQGSRFGAVSSAGMGYMGLGGYTPKPLAARLAEGEMLLAKDINTLFVDDHGKPLDRKQIPWQSAPESIGYSYPYILALQPPVRGSLEIWNPDTLSLLQNMSLTGAAQLHFPPPTVSLAHAGKGFHISSDRCVWKMDATDYDAQVDELVEGGKFDEAISVLSMLEDALLKQKHETLREVKMLKAEMLFKKKKFRQSMDLFNEDNVNAPPERVLALYPPSIAGELSGWAKPKDDNDEGDVGDPGESNGHSEKKSAAVESTSPETSQDTTTTASGLGSLLRFGHRKTTSDVASIHSKKDPGDGDDDGPAQTGDVPDDRPLEGKELTKAVLELNSYLAGTRARLQRVIDPATGKLKPQASKGGSDEDAIDRFLRTTQNASEKDQEAKLTETFRLVDTTLFRAYMFSQPSLTGSLLRIPNFCDPKVVNEKLLERNRYTELVDFFFGKKLHEEALRLLRQFGTAKKPDEAAPTLHGPDRAIQYLQGLSPNYIDLILQHADWTLDANADYAMEIFTGETENAETLPRHQVVAFFRNRDEKLERIYLEHIINELDEMEPDLHNRLAELYIKNLKSVTRNDAYYELMERFVTFLRESRQVYSLSKAFAMLPKDGKIILEDRFDKAMNCVLTFGVDPAFYEATAVVLSNMGNHKQALEIYVFKMKDYVKAEE